MQKRKQEQLYQCIPTILWSCRNHRGTELFLAHFELAIAEKAPFLQLNVRVLTPETFCNSSQIAHIYISQKAPEWYNYPIRSLSNLGHGGGRVTQWSFSETNILKFTLGFTSFANFRNDKGFTFMIDNKKVWSPLLYPTTKMTKILKYE